MSNTKKTLKWFDLMDYDKEAAYLRNMHKEGWKFKKVKGLGVYTFEQCEPADMVYQLDFSPEGLDDEDEYIQMFEDCGWRYLYQFNGYTYFCKPAEECDGEESIFSDNASREDMVKTIFWKRMVPLIVIYAVFLFSHFGPIERHNVITAFEGFIIVIYTIIFARFAWKYYNFRKEIGK